MSILDRKSILLVDDDAQVIVAVGDRLKLEGYQVVPAYSAEDGLRQLSRGMPDLIILDLGMPGMSGITFLQRISSGQKPRPPVLVFTARTNAPALLGSMKVEGCLMKSANPETLVHEVARLLGSGGTP